MAEAGAGAGRAHPEADLVIVVRAATPADRAVLVQMSVRFGAESSYRGFFTPLPEAVAAIVDHLLATGAIFVAVSVTAAAEVVVGMLAATVVVHPMSAEPTGSEIAWWVEPEFRAASSAGVRLLAAAEAWAAAQGAVRFEMIAPAGADRLGTFYRRRGYRALETTYSRPLAAAAR